MIPRTNYVKTLIKHMACDCKCKFKCQCECKKYRTSIKDYGWNPSACICGSSRYLKSSIVFDSVVVCDKIISVTDRVSTNVINKYQCFSKFWRWKSKIWNGLLHFAHVLLVTILRFLIAFICYHHTKHRSKQKHIGIVTI